MRSRRPKRAPADPGPGRATPGVAASAPGGLSLLAILGLLAAFLATQYPHAVTLPFVNDDYFFLDETRTASFASLWKRGDLIFGWYRPWSRELHYWVLQHLFGTAEPPYHLVSFALWLGGLGLYFAWARRIAGGAVAAVATAGLASLALWGTPLLWVAGAQDLWALLFSLVFLHLAVRHRRAWAAGALVLALLSKESAVILPGLATAYLVLIEGRGVRRALLDSLPLWLIALAWVALHPTLGARFFGSLRTSLETQQRPQVLATVAQTLLAQVNLHPWPHPAVHAFRALAQGAVGGAILAALVWRGTTRADSGVLPRSSGRLVRFGLVWALGGWSLLLMPSIGWHAYYGMLGSLGAWFALAVLLARRRRSAVALIVMLALLRSAQALTPSWDWGSESYQRRAGIVLKTIRRDLFRQHPGLPPHSRLYFVQIPNNVGLLAGDGPSLRVWYRDSTLRARYYSEYTPPVAGAPAGNDFFFRFDSLAGLVEIHTGPEIAESAREMNPAWEDDHVVLAALFLRKGDPPAAADEFDKLAAASGRVDYLIYAGACRQLMGDSAAARARYREVAAKLGYPLRAVEDSVRFLIEQLPGNPED